MHLPRDTWHLTLERVTLEHVTPEHLTLTDTHCHLDHGKFDPDRAAVLERAARAGLTRILVPGTTLSSSRAAVRLASSHSMLFAAVGLHPTEASAWTADTLLELRHILNPSGSSGASGASETSDSSRIVALGEIGLDYYWDSAPHATQADILRHQLDLASETSLPVILHMREHADAPHGPCAEDLLKILEAWCAGLQSIHSPLVGRPGVLHSFSGSLETARQAIHLGFYIGVTGPVTFENAHRRQEIVAALPLDRLLIETDAPFLAPHPQRGKRNEPAYVCLVAEKIASLHACSFDEVAARTSQNADRLFSWLGTSGLPAA
jgi:TatD DNase family protein